MRGLGYRPALLRYLSSIVLLTLLLSGVVLIICWLGGWLTPPLYAMGLRTMGSLVILAGILSLVGNFHQTRSFGYHYARTTGPENMRDRIRRDRLDIGQGYAFLVFSMLVGGLTTGLGVLIEHFWG